MSCLRRLPAISRRTMFSFTKKSLWQLPSSSAPTIPQHELVDEEICPDYNPAAFHPAKPGQVLAKNYQLLAKIGWGSQSTVWLARDISRNKWQSEETVALKIINNDNTDEAQHERMIERLVAERDPSHRGNVILRTSLDSFELNGPEGKHMCLVYEPMREPLWILQKRFINQNLPLPIAKAYIYILLNGLDYLHSSCKVVHTDLKLGNILMCFENDHLLSDFLERGQAMGYKIDNATGRSIFRCHNDFGPIKANEVKNFVPKISDFGLATLLDDPSPHDGVTTKQMGIYPIQPDHYRAPEVVLGCGWDFKADIWNFGVLLWNIIGSTDLFNQAQDTHGRYDSKSHLAEMISLLGPPPKELLERSDSMSQQNWPQPVTNEMGELCNNAREFFGGPFFSEDGEFSYPDLVPQGSLEHAVSFVEEKDREAFLSFARDMLAWLPEERKTARELMGHPFLTLGR
ncbi:hypothetical protein BDV06DRAFT_197124 [Aspergillus oleicola]